MRDSSPFDRLPLIGPLLRRRRERACAVQRAATVLILGRGDLAYPEARTRARSAESHATRRHWSRVALEIAERQDITVGGTVSDRYHDEARTWTPPDA